MAKTGQGAVELLRCGLVAQLIECQVFDMVPDSDAHRYECGKGRRRYSNSQLYCHFYQIVLLLILCFLTSHFE